MSRWMGVVGVSSWSPDPSIGMVPTPRHSAARARQAAGTYGLTPTLRKALVVLVLVRGNDEDVQPVSTETRMYRTRSSNSFFSLGSGCRRVLTCTWLDSTYGRRRRVPGTNFGVSRHVHAILYGSRRRLASAGGTIPGPRHSACTHYTIEHGGGYLLLLARRESDAYVLYYTTTVS
jgi:hypothetical protein